MREVQSHIEHDAKKAKERLGRSLRDVGNHWKLRTDKDALTKELIGTDTPKEVASNKVNDFVDRYGAVRIYEDKMFDMKALLERYFDVRPPFANTTNKKTSFLM